MIRDAIPSQTSVFTGTEETNESSYGRVLDNTCYAYLTDHSCPNLHCSALTTATKQSISAELLNQPTVQLVLDTCDQTAVL